MGRREAFPVRDPGMGFLEQLADGQESCGEEHEGQHDFEEGETPGSVGCVMCHVKAAHDT